MKKTTASNMVSIMALFAASMATSCSSDSLVADGNSGNGEGKTVTLTAKVNESDATTRVGMSKETDDAASFYWHSDDAILVQTVSGSTYSGAKFTTETATGETSAEFTGTVESGKSLGTYAVYPYSDKHSFTSATALTYNLPATYKYNKVESGIFSKTDGTNTTYRSTNTNIPMVGTIAENAIEFKHIGGLAVIRIDEMPATSGTLTVTADQQLCGDFTISDLSADGAAIATSTSATTTDNNTVTIMFGGATKNGIGVFYLPLATGSYSGLKITISYGTTMQTVNYGNLYVARASVNAIPLYNISGALCKWSAAGSDGTYTINGQKFVDLGLSVLWATYNVGASKAEDYGGYYAWGEITAYGEATDWGAKGVKTDFSWTNYKFGDGGTSSDNLTKYCKKDLKSAIEAEDDAATRNWGSGVKTPDKADFTELKSNCNWEWTTVNGVYGRKATSKVEGYTGNSIFFPASGYYDGTAITSKGEKGYYRETSLYDTSTYLYADVFFFKDSYSTNIYNSNYRRCYGMPVRPVAEK